MDRRQDKYRSNDRTIDPKTGLLYNKLGITNQNELERIEEQCLVAAYRNAALEFPETHSFTDEDIRFLHRLFLGQVYEWAGEYRVVDLSSGDIRWCHAKYIPNEMEKFARLIKSLTPVSPVLSREELLHRLAEIHGELIVIHPFRDGNGRVTRLLCDLLLMQAEQEPFGQKSFEDESIRDEYFEAVRMVWREKEYKRLIRLFDRLLSA